MRYYREDNGDYLAINPTTIDYYVQYVGKRQYEGRAAAIKGLATSVQTTAISEAYLRERCTLVNKCYVPEDWLKVMG